MREDDIDDFAKLWNRLRMAYGKPIIEDEDAMNMIMDAFDGLTLEQVKKAITQCIKTCRFAPVPADVLETCRRMAGMDDESLKVKGDAWYTQISSADFDEARDIITDDARAVAAFKAVFGSLSRFGARTAAQDDRDRDRFVRAYVRADVLEADGDERWCLPGTEHTTERPRVRFIGNEGKCRSHCVECYAIGQTPRFPLPRSEMKKRLAYKPQPQEPKADPAQCRAKIDEVLSYMTELTGAQE